MNVRRPVSGSVAGPRRVGDRAEARTITRPTPTPQEPVMGEPTDRRERDIRARLARANPIDDMPPEADPVDEPPARRPDRQILEGTGHSSLCVDDEGRLECVCRTGDRTIPARQAADAIGHAQARATAATHTIRVAHGLLLELYDCEGNLPAGLDANGQATIDRVRRTLETGA